MSSQEQLDHDDEDWQNWLENDSSQSASGQGLQNQAAGFLNSPDELRDGPKQAEDLKGALSHIGHFVVKFGNGKDKVVRSGSGCLIKKAGEKTWIMLTAAHTFIGYDEEDNEIELEAGMFALQRYGPKVQVASFKLVNNSIRIYERYDKATAQNEGTFSGKDIAMCVVEFSKGKMDQIPDKLPEMKCSEGLVQDFLAAGYPNKINHEGVERISNYFMYTKNGPIQGIATDAEGIHKVACHSNICSSGQGGGPYMVDYETESPVIIGIHNGAVERENLENVEDKCDDFEEEEEYTCGTLFTEHLMDQFINPIMAELMEKYNE